MIDKQKRKSKPKAKSQPKKPRLIWAFLIFVIGLGILLMAIAVIRINVEENQKFSLTATAIRGTNDVRETEIADRMTQTILSQTANVAPVLTATEAAEIRQTIIATTPIHDYRATATALVEFATATAEANSQ